MEKIVEKRAERVWQLIAEARKSQVKSITIPRPVMDSWISKNNEIYFEFGCPDYDSRYPVSQKITYPTKTKGQITEFLLEMGYTRAEIRAQKCQLSHLVWWNADLTVGSPKLDRWGDVIEY